MTEKLTVPEKLLLAALEARRKSTTFSAEDLVVQAWTFYPDTFGLSGYANLYPDSNRVLTNIMGTKGMRGKGWLRKVGEKQYRLTPTGLSDGEALLGQSGEPKGAERKDYLRAELDRGAQSALDRLVTTSAARKILSGGGEQVTFHDACGFWDITARSNANTLYAKLASTKTVLDRVMESLAAHDGSAGLKVAGSNLKRADIDLLMHMHQEMQGMFKAELDVIRRRTDERLERKTRPH